MTGGCPTNRVVILSGAPELVEGAESKDLLFIDADSKTKPGLDSGFSSPT